MADHPTKDELSGFVLGTLPPESTDSVADHLERCPPCQETVCELDAHKDTLIEGLRMPVAPLDEACRKFVEKVEVIPQTQKPEPATASLVSLPKVESPAAAAGPSREQFIAALRGVRLFDDAEWERLQRDVPAVAQAADGAGLARALVAHGSLTKFQATSLYQGKAKSLVFGEYVVLDLLGAGGMGQVFKARHRRMDRIVALKVLAKAAINSHDAVKRFQREVKAAAKLIHPNIVTAFDAGDQDGVHFLVMEYVEGSDLSSLIKRDGPLAIDKAVDYITQAARGLTFAHAEGVVHRDIKPANLLLDKKGVVKILDMGLARLDNEAAARDAGEGLTQTGQVMGTVDYMAPEQAFDTSRADGKADVYSLGCTLHRLVVGQNMFTGETLIQKLLAHREQPIPSLRAARSEVSSSLDAIYQRMVAKQAADRPTMAELIVELEKLTKGGSSSEQTDSKLTSFLTKQQVAVSHDAKRPEAHSKPAKAQGNAAGRKPPRRMTIAAAAAGFLFLAFGIVLLVRDKDNNVVAEIDATEGTKVKVPAGGSVEVASIPAPKLTAPPSVPTATSRPTTNLNPPTFLSSATPKLPAATPPVKPTVSNVGPVLVPGSGDDVLPGLVPRPGVVPGIKRWNIETVAARGGITAVAWSPDGRRLAVSSRDRMIRLYDFADDGSPRLTCRFEAVQQINGQTTAVETIGWSPEGRTLAWAFPGKIEFRSIDDGAKVGEIASGKPFVFSRDGKRIYALGDGNNLTIWSYPELKFIRGMPAPGAYALAESPDGNTIAVSALVKSAWLYRPDGSPVAALKLPDGAKLANQFAGLAWSSDSRRLLFSFQQTSAPFQVDSTGKAVPFDAFQFQARALTDVRGVLFSPDGKQVAAVSGSSADIRDATTWQPSPAGSFGTHLMTAAAWSPDGRRFATGGNDSCLRVWNAEPHGLQSLGHHGFSNIAWGGPHAILSAVALERCIRFWNAAGQPLSVHAGYNYVAPVVNEVDGATAVSIGGNDDVCFFSSPSSAIQGRMTVTDGTPRYRAYSPDGKLLAAMLSEIPLIRVWNAATREAVQDLAVPAERRLDLIVFGRDSRTLWLFGSAGVISRSLDDPQKEMRIDDPRVNASRVVADRSADRLLLGTNKDQEIVLYDLKKRQIVWSVPKAQNDFDLSRDGKFAACIADDQVQLRDAADGKLLKSKPLSQAAAVVDVRFSPDGKQIALATNNNTIELLDAATLATDRIIVRLDQEHSATLSASGEMLFEEPAAEEHLVYIVENADGRIEYLRPSGFHARVDAASKPKASTSVPTANGQPEKNLPSSSSNSPSPLDALERENIPVDELKAAGFGDPAKAPAELVAILGDSRLRHWNTFGRIVYLPDGKRVLTAGNDANVVLWDMATGRMLQVFGGPEINQPATRVAVRPDGQFIAVGYADGKVRVWDAAAGGTPMMVFEHAKESIITGLAYTTDGRTLISASHKHKTIKFWDPATGSVSAVFDGHTDWIDDMSISPDGRTLASAGADKTVRLWDVTNRKSLGVLEHPEPVRIVRFSPDGSTLASGIKTLRLWDVATRKEIGTGGTTPHNFADVAFSPDGNLVASSGGSGSGVLIWDREKNATRTKLAADPPFAFSPDGTTIVTGKLGYGRNNGIRIWDTATWQMQPEIGYQKAKPFALKVSSDGRTAIVAAQQSPIVVYDVLTGRPKYAPLETPTNDIQSIALSPDGSRLATGDVRHDYTDSSFVLWDVATGRSGKLATGLASSNAEALAFSPDGNTLAAVKTPTPDRKVIELWDVAENRATDVIECTTAKYRAGPLAFSPDGKFLAEGSEDGNVRLHDLAQKQVVATFSGHTSGLASITWSPDGATLAVGHFDRVKLWDVAAQKERASLKHGYFVRSVVYRPDGAVLASSAEDGSARLWNAATGELLQTLQIAPLRGLIAGVAFDATGRYLFTGNGNGTVYVLRLAP